MKTTLTIDPRMCLECPFLNVRPMSTEYFCDAKVYAIDFPPTDRGRFIINPDAVKDIPYNCPLRDLKEKIK